MHYKLETAKSRTGVSYDQIHLIRLNAQQSHRDNINDHPVFNILVKYRTYGVDAQGNVEYSSEGIKEVRLNDFLKIATEKQVNGDPRFLGTFQALTDLVWTLAAENENTIPVTNV